MTRKIILVRHGRTDWNSTQRFQGRTDIPLNEAGLEQAEKTAARLAGWPLDAVYTSPLVRARQTADAIAGRHGKAPIVLDDLTELHFGSWEGRSFIDSVKAQDEALFKWIADPFFAMPPDAEDWESVKRRAEAVRETALQSEHRHIVIVCHGGIMKGLLSVFLNLDPHTVWKIKTLNCSLTGIEIKEHETSLAFSNDAMHLRENMIEF